jgi:hypothetical protein
MTKSKTRRRSFLRGVLFLDILADRRTRPLYIYVAIIILAGAGLYHFLEGWSWLDSVYFVVVTLTTIGYGDLAPTTPLTKLITIFYGLNGVIILLMLFDTVRRLRRWELPDHVQKTNDASQ